MILAGCAGNHEGSPSVLSVTNAPPQMNSDELAKTNEMIAGPMNENARKGFEVRVRGLPPPPSEFRFPNVEGYAHHPRPNYVNFYDVEDRYPAYLQCEYDVDQKNYSKSNEPTWFKASLNQVRHFGPTKFPPIKWVAVIVCNVAEHNDASTFEQSFKVGAIFKASDVFDDSQDIAQLVTHAPMNRHPFKYDVSQPTPGDQQRWLIVEQHAVTNRPSTGSN
jgi:hypothetical protein